ncbi:SLC38A6 [Symbiodinium necroappetens]|uniref:SLC38A6 protein n=1 Tax=Symbiodinium necroappetens TaxID=1628268 RepID=A0A812RTQ9_9DINO|nr:SLC38A6 [Symbiodinium necroappetens]
MSSNGRKDVSNSIFLPAEQSQLCTLCDSFGGGGGDGTPGCPGVPTTTVAPPTFSPRCAWAQTGYEQSGGNAAGSYFVQLAECPIDGSSLATTRYIANRAGATNYQVPTDFEEVCLMFYEKRSGSANCRTVCEQLGSTCNRVLAAIGASGTDKCETAVSNTNDGNCGYDDENADDVQTFNDQICACNIPPGGLNDNPAPGENLDDIDDQTQADATDACTDGWLDGVTLPDPIPVDLSDLSEKQFALWSCIIDWSLADPQDRPDIVELTEEQNPTLPITPCASSDGTLPEAGAEPCRIKFLVAQAGALHQSVAFRPAPMDLRRDLQPTIAIASMPSDLRWISGNCGLIKFLVAQAGALHQSVAFRPAPMDLRRDLQPTIAIASMPSDLRWISGNCGLIKFLVAQTGALHQSVAFRPAPMDLRRRRKGQYYNDNGNGYYAGSPELIATEESEDSAFMQQEAYCENDDECEEEELGAETEL